MKRMAKSRLLNQKVSCGTSINPHPLGDGKPSGIKSCVAMSFFGFVTVPWCWPMFKQKWILMRINLTVDWWNGNRTNQKGNMSVCSRISPPAIQGFSFRRVTLWCAFVIGESCANYDVNSSPSWHFLTFFRLHLAFNSERHQNLTVGWSCLEAQDIWVSFLSLIISIPACLSSNWGVNHFEDYFCCGRFFLMLQALFKFDAYLTVPHSGVLQCLSDAWISRRLWILFRWRCDRITQVIPENKSTFIQPFKQKRL